MVVKLAYFLGEGFHFSTICSICTPDKGVLIGELRFGSGDPMEKNGGVQGESGCGFPVDAAVTGCCSCEGACCCC